MPSIPSNSSDNIGRTEARLLLYLLNELPGDDRTLVEQLINSDETARVMFDQLRAANEIIGNGLKRADSATPIGDVELASIARRTARLMSQQSIERLVRPTVAAPVRRWLPGVRTLGSLAASLAILSGLFIWWGNHVDPNMIGSVSQNIGEALATDNGSNGPDSAGRNEHDSERARRNRGSSAWGNWLADVAALNAADGLASAFDSPAISMHDKGLADAESQFDRLREVSELGRSDTATMTSR